MELFAKNQVVPAAGALEPRDPRFCYVLAPPARHVYAVLTLSGSTTGGTLLRRDADGGELWVEPAMDKRGVDAGLYWFMWYGPGRQQRIKHSAVFMKRDFVKAFAFFIGAEDDEGS